MHGRLSLHCSLDDSLRRFIFNDGTADAADAVFQRRVKRSVQYFKTAESEGHTQHKTQKPVALFEYLIKTYTNPGELVLDNCIGSGTTAVASINTNRNFIGFEMNEEYYRIACNRIEEHKKTIDN